MYTILRFLLWLPLRMFYPTKTVGKQYLKHKGSCIYAPNHQSWIDAFLVAVRVKCSTYYMGKKELFNNFFLRLFLKYIHAFPVDREALDMQSIRTVKKLFDNNKSLVMFPQGTRKDQADNFEGMKNGAVYFAIKFKTPIIPMYFQKKPRIFRRNKLIIGEPLYFDEYYNQKPTKEILSQASNKLIECVNELKNNSN